MVGQIITKETIKEFTFIVDNQFRTISKVDVVTIEALRTLIDKYNKSRDAEEREDIKQDILTLVAPGSKIIYESDNRFEMDQDGQMYLKGTKTPISYFLASKLIEYIDAKIPVEGLIKFWQRLLLNPDIRVQEQLYGFLEHNGHPITSNGYFLAYKAVDVKRKFDKETGEQIVVREYDEETGELIKEEFTQEMIFKPLHNGKHGMTIKVGEPVTMPREECDSDPHTTCSAGLHVGSMQYVGTFGSSNSVILEVLVSPTDVVAVPVDYNNTKMRTCKYFPIAITNGENSSIFLEEDYDEYQKEYLTEAMSKHKEAVIEAVKIMEENLAEKGNIVDSLY